MRLSGLRRRIDALDSRLLELVNERARVVEEVGRYKSARGLPLFDAGREAAIVRRLTAANGGPLGSAAVRRIAAVVVAECRRLEAAASGAAAHLHRGEMSREGGEGLGRTSTAAVVGLGLIGGSLAKALRERTRLRLTGVILPGKAEPGMRAVAHVLGGPEAALAADAVVLALPLSGIIDFLRRWGPRARPGTVWTDVGSVKAPVCEAARRFLAPGAAFVGGHPLAGSERSGWKASRADLFDGAAWALTPVPGRSGRALAWAKALAAAAGSRPFVVDARRHDRVVAFTSHLPQMAASALAAACLEILKTRPGRLLAGPGLRDTTRLADSPATIWKDIAALNGRELGLALEDYRRRLGRGTLAPSRVERLFRRARKARRYINRPLSSLGGGGATAPALGLAPKDGSGRKGLYEPGTPGAVRPPSHPDRSRTPSPETPGEGRS